MSGPFSADDLQRLSELVLDAWASGVDLDWSVPAGTLEWSCWTTAEHTIDCVFSYALFLASRKLDDYPNFGELHANPGATAADMVDGLRAVTAMLWSVIVTAPSDARAVIWRRPRAEMGDPVDFAARGGLEMILHAHDVCAGLGIGFTPPQDLCRRLWEHTLHWPRQPQVPASSEAWADLLVRSGRARVP